MSSDLTSYLASPPKSGDGESWVIASTVELRDLQTWTAGLCTFGREVVVRAAYAAATLAQAVLDEQAQSPSGDLATYLQSIDNGSPSPAQLLEATHAWLATPSPTTLAQSVALSQDPTLLNPDFLELPDLAYLLPEGWPFSVVSAVCAAVVVEHPEMEHWAVRGVVSAARARMTQGMSSAEAAQSTWDAICETLHAGRA